MLTSQGATGLTIPEEEAEGHRGQVREAALGQCREGRSPRRLLAPPSGWDQHPGTTHQILQTGTRRTPLCSSRAGRCVTPPAEPEGKDMEISIFSWGCRFLPISQQLALSPVPDAAVPASVLTGLSQSGLSQHQQSASFRDLGRER